MGALAAQEQERPSISVITVTYNSAGEIERSLPAIAAQLRDGDELIVWDNGSSDGTAERVRALVPAAIVHASTENPGFGEACNSAARTASGDLLLFLNPDAVVAEGFRDAIEMPVLERRGWSAWQGLVTDGDGALINTLGGTVHYTGIGWAGSAGRPISEAPSEPREVTYASGACLAIYRDIWDELGGFSGEFFLYHEDTDLGLRLWLAGHRSGIEPRARVDHEYEFSKGKHKWFYLERNRLAMIARCYPGRMLLPLLPGLLATELALLLVAMVGGWLPEKLRAYRAFIGDLPRLRRERAEIAAGARIEPARFADLFVDRLDSAFLGAVGRNRVVGALLAGYWAAVRLVVGRSG